MMYYMLYDIVRYNGIQGNQMVERDKVMLESEHLKSHLMI